jgi:hypothetical protein
MSVFSSQGGLTSLVQKTLGGIRTRVDTHGFKFNYFFLKYITFTDILFAFFGTNLIGMVFARSLHYQCN